ncbi:hypothetical protein GW755_03160 [bacterium]|nr:hypothetical protein [bacterium]
MNKSGLKQFGKLFILFYIFIFILTAFLVKTGIANYKTHVGRYWEDEKHLAMIMPNAGDRLNNNVYALSVPGWVPWSGGINAKIAGIEAAYDCVSNIQGFGQCATTGVAETATVAFQGGTYSECKKVAETADLNSGTLTETEKCPIEDSMLNKLNSEQTSDTITMAKPIKGGFMGLTTYVTKQVSLESENLANTTYYADYMQEQLPIFGAKTAKAYTWEGFLTDTTLGEGFFNIWKTALNFSYYLIIIPTVAFGFAIMFRMQINPQTQITLMRAIPKLLITILLITFSYPIASLMIQLAKPITDVVIGMLASFGDAATNSMSPELQQGASGNFIMFMLLYTVVASLGGGFVGIIIFVILLVMWVISMIRYLFAIVIISFKTGILIAFAPLILLVSAFPGKEGMIKTYFMNLASKIFGLSAISVMYAASFYVIFIGFASAKFIVMLASIFMSIGIMWNSPKAPKHLEKMLGVEPLFGGGDAGPPKRK